MSAGPGIDRNRSSSSKRIPPQQQIPLPSKGKQIAVPDAPFEPCAATGSSFLYAQANSVICLHHDTLAVQRRFYKHAEDILFISVDNVSERGAGRLVVTYDVGQTAIVWDLQTGEQVARFASYEPIKVASWMRNGNIAFGNTKGEVILFEPSTSEHVSARTIFDPITALAPSSDCKTYAIGYNNGSILLAALQPTFTILHTLTTSRGPSPITTLAWHASSSKQKSDMLATQTSDGDLRVWSVVKPPTNEAPRVIRVLRRSEEFLPGRNWIAWSKNGRIIQFSEGETWSWDVRTKHVTYEPIHTVEHVRAVANYGPTATLFTLGPNHSIQQYDLESGEIVANAQHFPMVVPPTPPEDSRQLEFNTSESEDLESPIGRATQEMYAFEAARQARNQTASPQSNISRDSERLARYAKPASRARDVASPTNKTERSATTNFSVGTQSQMTHNTYGGGYGLTAPSPVQSNRSRKGSRLKQEVLPSPEDKQGTRDLFPYTRARLNDVPYKPVRNFGESHLTSDDLRRQMLSVVFGWDQDIHELIRDELSRHPQGSQNALFLSKWLNDDPESMSTIMSASDMSSNLDWMMLALSGMGNHPQSKQIGQNFVEKMLSKGDIHAAAIILLSLGDRNDAIEVYVAANYFMEAILLTCLMMPTDWQRQKYLVRRWGEYVVGNAQQYLAIRCFSCTDIEPSEPWTSPTAQIATTVADHRSVPQNDSSRTNFFTATTPTAMKKPPTPMPLDPSQNGPSQRSALKLVTSFGAPEQQTFKFPGLKSDNRTPTLAPGVTPIAESAVGESALTPGGAGSYRLNNMRSINSALMSAGNRTATPGNFQRQRLPSIGETPIDVNPPVFQSNPAPKSLPTPADSGSEKGKEREEALKSTLGQEKTEGQEKPAEAAPLTLTLSSARYEPVETPVRETPLTALAPNTAVKFPSTEEPTIPRPLNLDDKESKPRQRQGSKSRKPDGLSIQMVPIHESQMGEMTGDSSVYSKGMTTGESSVYSKGMTTGDSLAYSQGMTTGDSLAFGQSLHRSNTIGSYTTTQFDNTSAMTSPLTTGNSLRGIAKSPGVTSRSIDQYISSLESAQYYSKASRAQPHGSQDETPRTTRKKSKQRTEEEERGRNGRRVIQPSKRSPSSPVPMSPDDLGLYTAPSIESFDSIWEGQQSLEEENRRLREERDKAKAKKERSESRNGERRHRSRSRHGEAKSRRTSPEPFGEPYARGRSKSKIHGSGLRSPSSPLPMARSEENLHAAAEVDPALRLVSKNRERRDRSERGSSRRREASQDRRKAGTRSTSRKPSGEDGGLSRKSSTNSRGERRRHNRDYSLERRRGRENMPSLYNSSFYSSVAPEDSISQVSTVDPESRSASNPQFSIDKRRREIAAAELEARRLSLARRPSAPSIPFPGQTSLHGKSASLDTPPPLLRSKTDFVPTLANIDSLMNRTETKLATGPDASDSGSSGMGSQNARKRIQGTPRAMRHPLHSEDSNIPNIPDSLPTLLGSDTYRPDGELDTPRGRSAPPVDFSAAIPTIPVNLPKHPAFDMRIPNSRSSSKPDESRRAASRERGFSRERGTSREPRAYPTYDNPPPPILPELQHLMTPPPPPPPPPPPVDMKLTVQTDFLQPDSADITKPASVPLPQSAEPPSASTATLYGHRRGRSGNDNNIASKFRNLAGRMRSTSRGRTNDTKSPMEETVSPYESIPLPQGPFQRGTPQIPEADETLAMSPYESIPEPKANMV